MKTGVRPSLRAATDSSKLRVRQRTKSCEVPSASMCDWKLLASRLFHSWRLVSSTPARLQPLMRSASSKHAGSSSGAGHDP